MSAKRQFTIGELATAAQLERSARIDRVHVVEKQVAARKRPEHDLMLLAGSTWPLAAIERALRLLDARRADLPRDLLEQIEGPL